MGSEDFIDAKTGGVKVEISVAMRERARGVAEKYDHILTKTLYRIGNTEAGRKSAMMLLEHSEEYRRLVTSVCIANPHLDPDTMGGFVQREDMKAARGGVLNDLIAEEAAKAGIKNVPAPFKTSARKKE